MYFSLERLVSLHLGLNEKSVILILNEKYYRYYTTRDASKVKSYTKFFFILRFSERFFQYVFFTSIEKAKISAKTHNFFYFDFV